MWASAAPRPRSFQQGKKPPAVKDRRAPPQGPPRPPALLPKAPRGPGSSAAKAASSANRHHGRRPRKGHRVTEGSQVTTRPKKEGHRTSARPGRLPPQFSGAGGAFNTLVLSQIDPLSYARKAPPVSGPRVVLTKETMELEMKQMRSFNREVYEARVRQKFLEEALTRKLYVQNIAMRRQERLAEQRINALQAEVRRLTQAEAHKEAAVEADASALTQLRAQHDDLTRKNRAPHRQFRRRHFC